MNTLEFFILIVFFYFAIAMLNVWIYKWIISRAVKQYINPYFNSQGYTVEQQKYPGIFSCGAFKSDSIFGVFVNGWPCHNTYVDIYATGKIGNKKRTTARITTSFFSIREVEYKDYKN